MTRGMAAIVVGTALLATACGGGGGSTGSTTYQTAYQMAINYAQCMRSHGLPGFPDPDNQGYFTITGPEVGDINAPRYQQAASACAHLDPSTPLTSAQQREALGQALKQSACMRSRGYPDFPDPIVGRDGSLGFRYPADIDPNSPQFQSVQQTCQQLDPIPGQ